MNGTKLPMLNCIAWCTNRGDWASVVEIKHVSFFIVYRLLLHGHYYSPYFGYLGSLLDNERHIIVLARIYQERSEKEVLKIAPLCLLWMISKVKNGKSFDRLDLVVKINFSNMFLWSKGAVIDTNFTMLDSAHAFFFLSMSFGVASTSIRMLCLPFLLGASLGIIYFPLKRKSKKKKLNMCWILYICGLRELCIFSRFCRWVNYSLY